MESCSKRSTSIAGAWPGHDTVRNGDLCGLPSDMKHPESLTNVVAFPGSGKIWPLRQCLDGFGQGIGIDMRLPCTEMLRSPTPGYFGSPFRPSSSAEFASGGAGSSLAVWATTASRPGSGQVAAERFRRVEDVETSRTPCRQHRSWRPPVAPSDGSRSPALPLNQPDALAQDFTGVLIAAGGNQPLDELRC